MVGLVADNRLFDWLHVSPYNRTSTWYVRRTTCYTV